MISWVKDKHGKFLSCNETLAEIAGLDSPAQIKGKKDADFLWKDNAPYIERIDFLVLSDKLHYVNASECLKTTKGRVDLLITKMQLLNNNKVIGTTGFALDITGYKLIKCSKHDSADAQISLGDNFNYDSLTKREVEILKYILLGHTAKMIGRNIGISSRTVEEHFNRIKRKLQCKTKGEVMFTCVKEGLTYLLYDDM